MRVRFQYELKHFSSSTSRKNDLRTVYIIFVALHFYNMYNNSVICLAQQQWLNQWHELWASLFVWGNSFESNHYFCNLDFEITHFTLK